MTALTVREAYQIWKRDFRRGRLLDDYTDFNARFRDMAYTTGLMPLPSGWTIPRWAMGMAMGGRGSIGYVLGRSQGAAAQWWQAAGVTPVAAYASKGAASLAASYTNLANPGTYNAAPGVAPTWDATNGWIFNGLTQYLTTGIAATSGSWSALIRFSNLTNPTSGGYLFGHTGFGIRPAGASTNHVYGNVGGLTVTGNVLSGVMAVTPTNGYLNGVSEGSISGIGSRANTIVIGAVNTGTVQLFATARIQALWIANAALSDTQIATMTTAMQVL